MASAFGVPLPVLGSTFFGAMKGGIANQKIEAMNQMTAQKNAAVLTEGMKTQETINRNLSASKDAATRNSLTIQMNKRDAEGAAAAEAASTGASPEQAVREVQRNAALAQDEADRELQFAVDQSEMQSWSNAQRMKSTTSPISYNPLANIGLAVASTTIPAMFKSGLTK